VAFDTRTSVASQRFVNWGLGLVGIDLVAWNTDHPALTIVFTLTWQYTR
jgi:polyol transport system permease protein